MKNNFRILVVDDTKAIHNDFRKILTPEQSDSYEHMERTKELLFGKTEEKKQIPPFIIHSAYQGEEAYNKIKKSIDENNPYAVAFVDVMMPPGEDGVQTIRRIWTLDTDIQIVICSAYSKYTWEDISNKFGDTDRLFILKKPFDKSEVLQLACSLTKKWNLNQAMQLMLSQLRSQVKDSNQPAKKTDLNETLDMLTEINNKLRNSKK